MGIALDSVTFRDAGIDWSEQADLDALGFTAEKILVHGIQNSETITELSRTNCAERVGRVLV